MIHAVGMAEPNRSHFSAMEEMERAAPGSSLRTGWLDRVLGLRDAGTAFQATQLGSNTAVVGVHRAEPGARDVVRGRLRAERRVGRDRARRWNTALGGLHADAPEMLASPAMTALDALGTAANLKAAGYTPANGAVYPDTGLGDALKDVARLIKAGVGLQVAAVDYGDWDMHVDQGSFDAGWMHDHLTELSDALAAFGTDLGADMDNVTLVTLTEFGRRVEENGSGGTDHGFGQAVLMMGGGVKGGQVHGAWPGLAYGDLIDGDLNATTDYRLVLAEILEKRCGARERRGIFPDIDATRPGVVNQRV